METTPDAGVPTPAPAVPAPNAKRELPPAGETELQQHIADIAPRLRRVCAQLPDEEFSALVLAMARVRMRYEQRVTPLRPEPPHRDD